jgi:hypothetical protein
MFEEGADVNVGGGGNCNILSIGGGFFGASAVAAFGLLAVVEPGGGGKSAELDSDGNGSDDDGRAPGAFPALSLLARACAAA